MRRNGRLGAVANVVVFALIIVSTAYSARFALGDAEVRHGHSTSAHSSNTALRDDGAEIYMTRCMSCHQMNGRGVPGVFPPLVDTEWVNGDKGRLIRTVLHGLMGEIKVGDETYSGAMPPWGSFLDDEEMAALLSYIRSSWGNDAPAVTPDDVNAVRSATEDRRNPWTEAELVEEANTGIPGADAESTESSSEDSKEGRDAEAGEDKEGDK